MIILKIIYNLIHSSFLQSSQGLLQPHPYPTKTGLIKQILSL